MYLGTYVKFSAVREDRKKVKCVGQVVAITQDMATVRVLAPLDRFLERNLNVDLRRELLIATIDGGWRYHGEFRGGVLVSGTLWKRKRLALSGLGTLINAVPSLRWRKD